MAIRTTSDAVSAIIRVKTGASLTPFIEAANALVTELCAEVTTYNDARLELIERWLSAHFYAIYDPRRESDKAGVVSKKIQSRVDLGFDVTHYGQMAMRLDTNGELAALNEQIKNGSRYVPASVSWLGTERT